MKLEKILLSSKMAVAAGLLQIISPSLSYADPIPLNTSGGGALSSISFVGTAIIRKENQRYASGDSKTVVLNVDADNGMESIYDGKNAIFFEPLNYNICVDSASNWDHSKKFELNSIGVLYLVDYPNGLDHQGVIVDQYTLPEPIDVVGGSFINPDNSHEYVLVGDGIIGDLFWYDMNTHTLLPSHANTRAFTAQPTGLGAYMPDNGNRLEDVQYFVTAPGTPIFACMQGNDLLQTYTLTEENARAYPTDVAIDTLPIDKTGFYDARFYVVSDTSNDTAAHFLSGKITLPPAKTRPPKLSIRVKSTPELIIEQMQPNTDYTLEKSTDLENWSVLQIVSYAVTPVVVPVAPPTGAEFYRVVGH